MNASRLSFNEAVVYNRLRSRTQFAAIVYATSDWCRHLATARSNKSGTVAVALVCWLCMYLLSIVSLSAYLLVGVQVAVSADRRLLQAARPQPGRDRHAHGLPAVHRAHRRAVLGQRGRALAPVEDRAAILAVSQTVTSPDRTGLCLERDRNSGLDSDLAAKIRSRSASRPECWSRCLKGFVSFNITADCSDTRRLRCCSRTSWQFHGVEVSSCTDSL